LVYIENRFLSRYTNNEITCPSRATLEARVKNSDSGLLSLQDGVWKYLGVSEMSKKV
jgi:hypothetical protein